MFNINTFQHKIHKNKNVYPVYTYIQYIVLGISYDVPSLGC